MPLTEAERRARHAAGERARRARWSPTEREANLAAQRARAQARYVPKPRTLPERDPDRPCPYCSGPMRPRQRCHCGEPECRRRYMNERNVRFQREYRERTGRGYLHERYAEQRAARSKAAGYTESKRAAYERRRARKAGVEAEVFDRREVFDRDGWACGICDEPVDRDLAYPDPLSVSLDHVIPLDHGGPHTRANTRCAHLVCNVRRGARLDAEMAGVTG